MQEIYVTVPVGEALEADTIRTLEEQAGGSLLIVEIGAHDEHTDYYLMRREEDE